MIKDLEVRNKSLLEEIKNLQEQRVHDYDAWHILKEHEIAMLRREHAKDIEAYEKILASKREMIWAKPLGIHFH